MGVGSLCVAPSDQRHHRQTAYGLHAFLRPPSTALPRNHCGFPVACSNRKSVAVPNIIPLVTGISQRIVTRTVEL